MILKATQYLDRAMEAIVVILFAVLVVVGSLQVFNRFAFNISLSWSEELQKYLHIWLIYFTIPIVYNRGAHIGVDILIQSLPDKPKRVLQILVDLLWLALAVAIVHYTLIVMNVAKFQVSPGIDVSMDKVYFGMVIGGAYLVIAVLRSLARRFGLLPAADQGAPS